MSEDNKTAGAGLDERVQHVITVLSLYAVYEKLLATEAITREVFNDYLSKLKPFEQLVVTNFLAKESELVKAIQGKIEEKIES